MKCLLTTICFSITAVVTAAQAVLPSNGSIRLYKEATSESEVVCLSDIAEIETASETMQGKLDQLEITRFSKGIDQVTVGYYEIRRALAKADIMPAGIDLYGAMECHINLKGAISETSGTDSTEEPSEISEPVEPEAAYPEGCLANELKVMIARLGGFDPGSLDVTWRCDDPELLKAPANGYKVQMKTSVALGKVCFEVKPVSVESQEAPAETQNSQVRVYGTVTYLCESYVASRALQEGEIIGAEDLKSVIRRIDSLREIGITNKDAVVGMEAARTIPAHHLILPSMVKKVLLVKRNDLVELTSRVGQVHITTQGTAKTDGGMGDIVTVRDDHNKTLIRGRVTGPGAVSVTPEVNKSLPIAAAGVSPSEKPN